MGIEAALITLAVGAAVAGIGTALSSSISSRKSARQTQRVAQERQSEINAQKAADAKARREAATIASRGPSASRRLALISTSPQGTLKNAATGRGRLFGN